MRVEVITLHSVANYGTQLQALATQEKLNQYFDEVSFIDFRRSDTYGLNLLRTFSRGNLVRGFFAIPTLLIWHFRFGNFRRKYLNLTKQKYLKTRDFNNFKDDADCYAVGSDQVWNTGWNNGIIPAFYLNFVSKNKPKFSFSSSFGVTKLEDKDINEIRSYLRTFKKISVRELSGVNIVKNQLGISNVTRLVDPVLSMPAEFWRHLAPKTRIQSDYILIYSLNHDREMDCYAKKLSKMKNLKLIRLCTRIDQITRGGKCKIIPKILDFVSLIDNASYVITDSFHATAFSMLMNTEPICVYPSHYSTRISEFLELVGENERHLNSYTDFDIVNHKVNFEKVNKILEKERERVDRYLVEATNK